MIAASSGRSPKTTWQARAPLDRDTRRAFATGRLALAAANSGLGEAKAAKHRQGMSCARSHSQMLSTKNGTFDGARGVVGAVSIGLLEFATAR